MQAPAFAAVDWGTSSFRLWLMTQDGKILAERRSGEGMTSAAQTGFGTVLDGHLAAVEAPSDLPVIICGMAGARQGWVEARYLEVPARLDGIAAQAVRVAGNGRDVRILPGLAQRVPECADVMRGEETQLLGAMAGRNTADGLCCMPGTHCKWVRLEEGRVAGFSTFMTGELFAVIAKHSILSHAVGEGGGNAPDDARFRAAVVEGFEEAASLTGKLFSIRGGQLLFDEDAATAQARLSGLLIGAELAGCGWHGEGGEQVTLIASGGLRALYEAAFAAVGIEFDMIDADEAVRAGLHAAAKSLWASLWKEW